MKSEWWVEQKRKADRIFRMWFFAALLLGFTVLYGHLCLRYGHMNPASVLPLVIAMPLAIASATGVF